jgi:predicted DNA-binding transcriptional regulator
MPDMRFAPPNPLRIADRASGLNSVSVRSYNERLVLSLLLQSEATTRLEIGERTGLSAQTVSVLVRSLEQEGLVARGEAQKGRVGPPTVPLALNPDGAFSIGISIGPREAQVVLIDFVGKVRFSVTLPRPRPDPNSNHSEFLETIRSAIDMVPVETRDRLAGVGLALPHADEASRPGEHYFQALQAEIEGQLGIPVFVQNDVTAAAGGESMFGAARPLTDYLYIYLGSKLHGRLVLNHQIYHGNSSVHFDVGLEALDRTLQQAGQDSNFLWASTSQWPDLSPQQAVWEQALVNQIVLNVDGVRQFVELEAVVLSSPIPEAVTASICERLQARVSGLQVVQGTLAPSPKAIGAAGQAFSSRFMVE